MIQRDKRISAPRGQKVQLKAPFNPRLMQENHNHRAGAAGKLASKYLSPMEDDNMMVLFSFCISHLGMVPLQTGGAHCSLYVDSFKIHII